MAMAHGSTGASEEHVVTVATLHQRLAEASDARTRDLAALRAFLAHGRTRRAVATLRVDPKALESRIGTLDDEDLHALAGRARVLETDPVSGMNSGGTAGLIVLGVVVVLVVLIVAEAISFGD
jgi:hypothetical protein